MQPFAILKENSEQVLDDNMDLREICHFFNVLRYCLLFPRHCRALVQKSCGRYGPKCRGMEIIVMYTIFVEIKSMPVTASAICRPSTGL